MPNHADWLREANFAAGRIIRTTVSRGAVDYGGEAQFNVNVGTLPTDYKATEVTDTDSAFVALKQQLDTRSLARAKVDEGIVG